MSDSPLEFLNENASRRYPFRDDSSLLDSTGVALSDGVLLDARGFYRDRPDVTPRLACLVGPDAEQDAVYASIPDHYVFYWTMGKTSSPIVIPVAIPVTESFPAYRTGYVRDSRMPNRDVRRAGIQIVVGEALLNIPLDVRLVFRDDAILESTCIDCLYRGSVDEILLIHREDATESVSSDVVLRGGYSVGISSSTGQIRIAPALGAGELGRFTGSLSSGEASRCLGRLLSINGVSPTSRGEFFLRKGSGIEIIEYPDLHKIVIKVADNSLGGSTICST